MKKRSILILIMSICVLIGSIHSYKLSVETLNTAKRISLIRASTMKEMNPALAAALIGVYENDLTVVLTSGVYHITAQRHVICPMNFYCATRLVDGSERLYFGQDQELDVLQARFEFIPTLANANPCEVLKGDTFFYPHLRPVDFTCNQ